MTASSGTACCGESPCADCRWQLGSRSCAGGLFDIDLVVNRTLVYTVLTALVAGLYIFVVTGVGALFQTEGGVVLPLFATGIVAVAFQPLRQRVQRAVNRLLYGDRDDPYAVITRLGQQLEGTLASEEILPAVVRTMTEALRLPYAAVMLHGANAPEPAAAAGIAVPGVIRMPLVSSGRAGRRIRSSLRAVPVRHLAPLTGVSWKT